MIIGIIQNKLTVKAAGIISTVDESKIGWPVFKPWEILSLAVLMADMVDSQVKKRELSAISCFRTLQKLW